ncbi:MAG: FAD-dependent oxidoreductase [Pirellulaceae bacterium]|nr:FAD-dependent oxidoreductase [Pirellulaceae bacterium]MDP7015386.1 FAD-dependent oxidoreductase [Pirellulaceae bacterium]
MKIAVVGAGISGLVAARRLTEQGHDVSVFEASDRFGGHVQSVSLQSANIREPVEAGFLVFNETACPRLTGLLQELRTSTRKIEVAFEISNPQTGVKVRGASLRELLAVPMNLAVPSFYRLVPDWVRFTRQTRRQLQRPINSRSDSLGEFLSAGRYSRSFADQFVYPLAAAIFPVRRADAQRIPLANLVSFLHNHGLLKLDSPVSCRTLAGGSTTYLNDLTEPFRDRVHLNCPVTAIARSDQFVLLKFADRPKERFEQVVIAVHADVALRILADHTRQERELLETFEFAPQDVYIHWEHERDTRPPASLCWRYRQSEDGAGVAVSYRIATVTGPSNELSPEPSKRQLQNGDAPRQLMLTTMSADHRPPDQVIRTLRFRRPVFNADSQSAQRRVNQISGQRRTYYCGAYWGNGFHEDAVGTAENAVAQLARKDAAASRESFTQASV